MFQINTHVRRVDELLIGALHERIWFMNCLLLFNVLSIRLFDFQVEHIPRFTIVSVVSKLDDINDLTMVISPEKKIKQERVEDFTIYSYIILIF